MTFVQIQPNIYVSVEQISHVQYAKDKMRVSVAGSDKILVVAKSFMPNLDAVIQKHLHVPTGEAGIRKL